MYDQDYYVNLVVDLIVGDPYPDLPRELRDPLVDEEMLEDLALTLRRDYPNAVRQGIWTGINLRKSIDIFLDGSGPVVEHTVFGDHFFSEEERQEILNQCAQIIRKKLQRYIRRPLRVCYKVMPNGRVGYRLE